MKYNNTGFAYLFIISLCICGLSTARASDAGIMAITIPSADITMSFVKAGIIDNVYVKEGDEVMEAQMLIQQDTEAAEASLAQKRIDLKRLEWAAERGSATELEVEHAKLEVKVLEIVIDDMTLHSPIIGTVDVVEFEVGEAVNGLEDVIRVVKTDPLWIDVPLPLEQGRNFEKGQMASVIFPGEEKPVTAEIIYVSTVADAASSTLRVRVEVSNPRKRPAGEHVRVSFPATAASLK
jgi:multidrug efflux pump subunit AcrA (membrane-fusion protein)